MHPFCAFAVACVVSSLLTPLSSLAAPPPSGQQQVTPINYADVSFDYELYAAVPKYGWWIIWDLGSGQTHETGTFSSPWDAVDFAEGLIEYNLAPEGWQSYEIVEVEKAPTYKYVFTYDKKVDAQAMAASLENAGLYTKIEFVYVLSPQVMQPNRL